MLNHAITLGTLTAGSGFGMLAAASTDPTTGIAPYVGGGAGVIAVMALGEVTRRLLNGRLIPRETRDMEAEMQAYILAAGEREARLMKVVEDGQKQSVQIAAEVKAAAAKAALDLAEVAGRQSAALLSEMGQLTRAVEDLRDEIRRTRREGQ